MRPGRMRKERLRCLHFHFHQVKWTEQSVASRQPSYSIVPTKLPWRTPEAFRFQSGVSFCGRKISTFISKFAVNEDTRKFWVKYFHRSEEHTSELQSHHD